MIDDFDLRFVQSSNFDENVLRFQRDLAVIAVDDGR